MEKLSVRLRDSAQNAQLESEGGTFSQRMLAGKVTATDYSMYLFQLRAVYDALETGLQKSALDPRIAPIVWPQLSRLDAIDADLAHFKMPEDPTIFPSTMAYVSHLEEITEVAPHRLIAHSYVRYIGDMSDGQAWRRALLKIFKLSGTVGTELFEFRQFPDLAAAKVAYRLNLNELPLLDTEAQAVVDEASVAVRMSVAIENAMTPRKIISL